MTLDFLIPQYDETDEVIKPLLDSIALQQNVDFKEVGLRNPTTFMVVG